MKGIFTGDRLEVYTPDSDERYSPSHASATGENDSFDSAPLEITAQYKKSVEAYYEFLDSSLKTLELPVAHPVGHDLSTLSWERRHLRLPPASDDENSMLQRTYGKRLAAHITRSQHLTTLNKLNEFSATLYAHIVDCEDLIRTPRGRSLSAHLSACKSELVHIDILRDVAKKIVQKDVELTRKLEQQRPENLRLYQEKATEIRRLIEQNAAREQVASKMSELQAFEENLQKTYQGADPYPQVGLVQSTLNWAQSWLTSVDAKPTLARLVLEYSLAQQGISSTSQAYQRAFSETWAALGDPQKLAENARQFLQDLPSFVTRHPVLAASMAAQLAHVANLLSENANAGAMLQNLIFQQRVRYLTIDILAGDDGKTSYAAELDNPLTVGQIVMLDALSKMPLLIAAYEGSGGRTLGGSAGYSIAGPIGGALGGLAHAKAQEVLAESLDRETARAASLAVSFIRTSTLIDEWNQAQTLYEALNIPYVAAFSIAANYASLGKSEKLAKKVGRLRRGDLAPLKKSPFSKGLEAAVAEADASGMSKPVLIAYNAINLIRKLKSLAPAELALLPNEIPCEFLYQSIDWAKKGDTAISTLLTMLRPFLSAPTNVKLEAFKDNALAHSIKMPREFVLGLIGIPEAQAYLALNRHLVANVRTNLDRIAIRAIANGN
ncbi:MAG: hypothetical protein V4534_04975 [Myxococcota bacterium]